LLFDPNQEHCMSQNKLCSVFDQRQRFVQHDEVEKSKYLKSGQNL
jgi:hypothetical protein